MQIDNLILLMEEQRLEKSDAIIWLQGDRYDRGPKILSLFNEGFAPKIVISGNNVLLGDKRPGEDNISLPQMKEWLLKNEVGQKNIIIDENSLNTKNQAKNVIDLAIKNKWTKIILVASRYHQPRAFLTFLKIGWRGKIINQFPADGWDKIPDGRKETQKQLLESEVKKINEYKNDVALIEEGINYLKNE